MSLRDRYFAQFLIGAETLEVLPILGRTPARHAAEQHRACCVDGAVQLPIEAGLPAGSGTFADCVAAAMASSNLWFSTGLSRTAATPKASKRSAISGSSLPVITMTGIFGFRRASSC